MECFIIVLLLWVFSVCLHEYGHAKVAQMGGDHTVEEKGYLSMNPLHYAHPVMSFVLPIVFLIMGGLALPGGAVYIDRSLIRSRGWNTAVSLAGPAMNLLLAILLAVALHFFFIPRYPYHVVTLALSFTVLLQITSVLYNLIPLPPLDGFNAILPWTSPEFEAAAAPYANWGIGILIAAFWFIPGLGYHFFLFAANIAAHMGVDPELAIQGWMQFEFWKR